MGCLSVVFLIFGIIITVKFLKKYFKKCCEIPKIPRIEEIWWGAREQSQEDITIKPFNINVSDEVLQDLQVRLENVRPFIHPLDNVHHQYGINTKLLSDIIEFWRTKYNWRERETFLNQYPQYTVSVQGLRIHYLHVKPSHTDGLKVVPLLMLHGWPGSVREFYEIIPILTSPQPGQKIVFEVIAPSLPGYGFSEAAVKPGLGGVQMAVLFKNFMKTIGFEKYYLQGGDWGALIIQNMATLYPEHILGVHSNMCLANTGKTTVKMLLYSLYPSLFLEERFVKKLYPLKKYFQNLLLEFGYMHLQASKPDTIGVALNDSPVGLAAYILEKFITWTNPAWKNRADGGLDETYSYTKLLDNVMIYWVTNSITTSFRLYAENFSIKEREFGIVKIPVKVPAGCSRFAHELVYHPNQLLNDKYQNLIYEVDHSTGGHFAAFQLPDVLAKDIFEAVARFERYYMYGY